ncbi:MAG TPA: hypothetical protein DC058_09550, partial [Planctomycetaceae bacterium]|nr:hypothetical protein [Planctomycetaceae bacterium]
SPPRGGEGRIGCQWTVSVAGGEVICGQNRQLIFAASRLRVRNRSAAVAGGGLRTVLAVRFCGCAWHLVLIMTSSRGNAADAQRAVLNCDRRGGKFLCSAHHFSLLPIEVIHEHSIPAGPGQCQR